MAIPSQARPRSIMAPGALEWRLCLELRLLGITPDRVILPGLG